MISVIEREATFENNSDMEVKVTQTNNSEHLACQITDNNR